MYTSVYVQYIKRIHLNMLIVCVFVLACLCFITIVVLFDLKYHCLLTPNNITRKRRSYNGNKLTSSSVNTLILITEQQKCITG